MRVEGHSMAPVVPPGALVCVETGRRQPPRGAIVAVRPAALGGRALLKRVAGFAQDGALFVRGDGCEHSVDSRRLGPIRQDDLVGVVRLSLWPWRWLAPSGASTR